MRRALLWIIVGACIALLLWTRLAPMGVSFWRDEILTVTTYVSGGPQTIFGGEYTPNNHVLFSVLAWLTSNVLGRSEVVYRLWSVLPAIAGVGVLSWWAWKRQTRYGLVALLLLTASPTLLVLSPQARGYGLAFLAMSLVVVGAAEWNPWLLGAGTVTGSWALPVFVLPAGCVLVYLAVVDRQPWVFLTAGASAVLVAMWYAPLVGQVFDAAGQDFGSKLPWHAPVSWATDHSGARLSRWAAGAILLVGGLDLWRDDRRLLGILLVPVVGTYTVLVVAGLGVVPRFVSYLAIPTLALMAYAAVRTRPVVVSAVLLVMFVGVRGDVMEVTTPIEALRGAAVHASQAEVLYTNYAHPQLLEYYTDGPVKHAPGARLATAVCDEPSAAAIHKGRDFDPGCEGSVESFPQRAPPGQLEVWLPH